MTLVCTEFVHDWGSEWLREVSSWSTPTHVSPPPLVPNPWPLCPPLAAHSDIAGMLLKSTGDFLDAGLQKSGDEFWESADDSTASDEIRWEFILYSSRFHSVKTYDTMK